MAQQLLSLQLYPGRALGFFVLGASLHDTITRLKAEPQRFPKLELLYSPQDPVRQPVVLTLPANGLRLRFDGPEQRLRLVEAIDFSKNHIVFKPSNDKERDLVRPANASDPLSASSATGPTFRHIYNRFLGPTYEGEYIAEGESGDGTYVLSYPGVAFTFPMPEAAYSPQKDVVTLLSSSSASHTATSMAVFSGDSWAQARDTLWTEVLSSPNSFAPLAKGRDLCPDEVSLVRIHGGGQLQLVRRDNDHILNHNHAGNATNASRSSWISLGETTPQELVAELGPPDAIYRKNDQRMYIHKIRTASHSRTRRTSDINDPVHKRPDDLTDTDQSSAHVTASDASDDDDEQAIEDDIAGTVSGECFYNYFYLGFDVLVSTPTPSSRPPPSSGAGAADRPRPLRTLAPDRLVATKLVLHGNVPGSYPFNRHRRCRWEIAYLEGGDEAGADSETVFTDIEAALREEWRHIYASDAEARQRQRGMVLNRGWGDSPGSSCELLGGWEEGRRGGGGTGAAGAAGSGRRADGVEDSTTTLYGFPGLVFEVLKNGFVSALTVF